MRFRALAVAPVLVGAAACGTPADRGAALYGDARYIEAAEVFERTEGRLPHCGSGERAEYGLYRGLTFLELGDLRGAREWLGYAASIERKEPGHLSGDQRRQLARGLSEVERRAHEEPEAPAPAATTIAAGDDTLGRGPANGRRSVRE